MDEIGIVDELVQLLVIAAAHLLRRQEAEIIDDLERRLLGRQVLHRLRARRRRDKARRRARRHPRR